MHLCSISLHESSFSICCLLSNGLSECFFSGEHNAFLNGIHDAVGVRIYSIPARPEQIKAGLEKNAAGEISPAPYFLGSDFYDELEELMDTPSSIAGRPAPMMLPWRFTSS